MSTELENTPFEDGGLSVRTLQHGLSERLTAMIHYFALARAHVDKGELEAANHVFAHYIEQSDRARTIAESIRSRLSEQSIG